MDGWMDITCIYSQIVKCPELDLGLCYKSLLTKYEQIILWKKEEKMVKWQMLKVAS
jgi:hypothetical protein